jgi:hypothetical protein
MDLKRVTKSELQPFFNSHSEIRRIVHADSVTASQKMCEQDLLIRRMAKTIEDLVGALEKQKAHTFRFFPMPFGCKKAFLTSPMFLDTEAAGKLLDEFNEVPPTTPEEQVKFDDQF